MKNEKNVSKVQNSSITTARVMPHHERGLHVVLHFLLFLPLLLLLLPSHREGEFRPAHAMQDSGTLDGGQQAGGGAKKGGEIENDFNSSAFEALERDFQEVLSELVGDKSLERFRWEVVGEQRYEKEWSVL